MRLFWMAWARLTVWAVLTWERVTGKWIYCPDCESCGIGGCCAHYCDTCRHRHDMETQDGTPPHDYGRLPRGWWWRQR